MRQIFDLETSRGRRVNLFVTLGKAFDRSALDHMTAIAGLVPVRSVTKKNCDLLVAADVVTDSGKARKARAYGIPLISVADFVNLSG